MIQSEVLAFFHEVGSLYNFTLEVRRTWWRRFHQTFPLLLEQIISVWIRSLPTVVFSGFFVGAILIVEFQMMLSKYDATTLIGGLNTSAIIREIGPMLISFLLAGKVGAYTAAELGTMRVTEQIDAIRCLGTDPLEYLVVPRFISIVFCSILLLVVGLLVGTLGSMLVAGQVYNVNYLEYLQTVPRFVDGWTVFGGLFKSYTYGLIVAAVSTYKGYTASGGAKGVGIAVTRCSIYTNLLIVFANSFTTYVLEGMQEIWKVMHPFI